MAIVAHTSVDSTKYPDIKVFLEAIHELDVKAYSAADAGEVMPMVDRYSANPMSYIYLEDTDTNKLVGYINFFPCNEELKGLILSKDTPYDKLDDEITRDQIVPFVPGNMHFIYILSIVVDSDYRGRKFDYEGQSKSCIQILSDEYVNFLRYLVDNNQLIEGMGACAVSPGGARVLRSLRFRFDHHVLSSTGQIAVNTELGNFKKSIFICDNEVDFMEDDSADDTSNNIYIHIDDNGEASDTQTSNISPVLTPGYDNGGSLNQLLAFGSYVKTYKDDVYLMLPLTEHATNAYTDELYTNECYDITSFVKNTDTNTSDSSADVYDADEFVLHINGNVQIPKRLISKLRDCIEYECDNNAIKDLQIMYLGCFDFLNTTDQYPCSDKYDPIHSPQNLSDPEIRELMYSYSKSEIEIGLSKGYVILTAHKPTHMYVVSIFFPNFQYSTTQLEDQLSNDYIKIVDPSLDYRIYEENRNYRYIRLYDYLWEKFHLHKCGQEKILLCMNHKPNETLYPTEFQNILSAEVYNSVKVDYHIDSPTLREQCDFSHAQYDYYDVYLSNKVIAFIPKEYGDINERIDITATYSFIAELVMFQNTALARMNIKITEALSGNGIITMEEVLDLDREYGKTIPFWEPNNFSYPGAQAEADCIKNAFSNEKLKETYDSHQEFLEHIVDLKASEQENRNSSILNTAATLLAIIQVESFITKFLERFYNATGIIVDKSFADFEKTFSNTLIGALLLIVLYLIIMQNINKDKKKKRRRKK